jgi:TonB family protein
MKTAIIILFFLLSYSFGFAQNDSLTKTKTLKDSSLVDVIPIYPGGEKALLKYISRNIEHPKSARKGKIQGKVYVLFVVNENGLVEDVTILKGLREDINEAAITEVEEMPAWTPGKLNGKSSIYSTYYF